jgi:hypothetical protein
MARLRGVAIEEKLCELALRAGTAGLDAVISFPPPLADAAGSSKRAFSACGIAARVVVRFPQDVSMRQNLPGRTDLAIFGVLALVCAAIVSNTSSYDVGLSLLSIPLFICAALLGMFRCGHLKSDDSDEPSGSGGA